MKETLPILLTGASGFLGKMLRTALEKKYAVVTIGRSPSNDLQLDLSQTIPIFQESFHTVVHNAGKAHVVPRTEAEAAAFFQVNYQGTLHLLAGLEKSPKLPAQFVFISTVAVYGVEQGENIAETQALNGATPYALSKIQAEQAVQDWCKRWNVKCVILRLPLVVGENPPGNLGAMLKAIQRGYYVKIKGNTARKSAVLGTDVAQLIANLPDKEGIYNLTDGVHPSFAEIEQALEKATGKPIQISISNKWMNRLATIGDRFAALHLPAPLTTAKLEKLTGTLTFKDDLARRELAWNPQPVLPFLEKRCD